jgi:hypothetical protein
MVFKTGLHNTALDQLSDQTDPQSTWIDITSPPAPTADSIDKFSAAAAPAAIKLPAPPAQILYGQETGDSSAINVDDLHQGQLGDCFLISSIGELALNKPSDITNMIHVNTNGTETVTLYTATNGQVAGFGATAFKATSVTVTNTFSSSSVNNGSTQDVVNGSKEIWPQVLEKAIATLDGGYNDIANGGNPMIAMQELTGHAATFMSPTQLTAQLLQSMINAGDMIVMDTANALALPDNLVGSHAYMFEKMTTVGGQAMVQLGNPWGFDQPSMIPVTQLAKAGIVEVDVGRVA